ncbi:MAG: alkaline phosphatase [Bacteroidia bacterium]
MKRILLVTVVFCGVLLSYNALAPKDKEKVEKPENVIIMIGDGMGLSQISAAKYANGGTLNLDRFGKIGMITTHSANNLITDSGAGATAFACGIKTNNGYIGVDAEGNSVKNIFEIAQDKGMKTGVVATSSVSHATPAAFVAHIKDRKNEFNIAEQITYSNIDLFIGGGSEFFFNRNDDLDLKLALRKSGFKTYSKLKSKPERMRGDKIAVLAAKNGMPPASQREDFLMNAWKTVESNFPLRGLGGYMLMIEGSQIDWAGHEQDQEYMISELLDFDKVVGSVLDYAQMSQKTLVIVLADHETGGHTITAGDADGTGMAIEWTTKDHTASMVPVYSYGPGSELFVGTYDNTDIFHKLKKLIE